MEPRTKVLAGSPRLTARSQTLLMTTMMKKTSTLHHRKSRSSRRKRGRRMEKEEQSVYYFKIEHGGVIDLENDDGVSSQRPTSE
jgi:glutamine synthetase adenylyltransferase